MTTTEATCHAEQIEAAIARLDAELEALGNDLLAGLPADDSRIAHTRRVRDGLAGDLKSIREDIAAGDTTDTEVMTPADWDAFVTDMEAIAAEMAAAPADLDDTGIPF